MALHVSLKYIRCSLTQTRHGAEGELRIILSPTLGDELYYFPSFTVEKQKLWKGPGLAWGLLADNGRQCWNQAGGVSGFQVCYQQPPHRCGFQCRLLQHLLGTGSGPIQFKGGTQRCGWWLRRPHGAALANSMARLIPGFEAEAEAELQCES